MKQTLSQIRLDQVVFFVVLSVLGLSAFAEEGPVPVPLDAKPVAANCELRLVEPSQAGSTSLATFTSDEASCLKLADDKTTAQFSPAKPKPNRRVPVGPQE